MKNTIEYYYNIISSAIHYNSSYYYFIYNDENYYFMPCKRAIEELKNLYELNQEMIQRNLLVHEMILNKDNNIITVYNDTPYILMKIYTNPLGKIYLSDIDYLGKKTIGIKGYDILNRNNWVSLWSEKIDYIEYQMNQKGNKYPIISESIDYFIGLAENAISYVKDTQMELRENIILDTLVVSHKRIAKNETLFSFNNPLNLVIDYKIRDICEYIRSGFYNYKDVIKELIEYLKYNNLSEYSARLLFGRLLFPSTYFDMFESILNEELEEKEIINIVERVNDYEDLLFDVLHLLKTKSPMKDLEWLKTHI